jgi:hypothetical protein
MMSSRDNTTNPASSRGARATVWDYPEEYKLKIYSDARWRHAPELIELQVKAFEKVWAHRAEFAKV